MNVNDNKYPKLWDEAKAVCIETQQQRLPIDHLREKEENINK